MVIEESKKSMNKNRCTLEIKHRSESFKHSGKMDLLSNIPWDPCIVYLLTFGWF